MSTLIIQSETLEDIADAIRTKSGSSDTMTPLEMPSEIENLPTGGGSAEVAFTVNSKVATTTGEVYTYTTTKSGKLYLAISSYIGYVTALPTLYINNVSVSATSSSYSTPQSASQRLNMEYFSAIDVNSGDVLKVDIHSPGTNYSKHLMIFGIIV